MGKSPAWGQAAPAFAAADKIRVCDKEQKRGPVGDSCCDGGAVEAEPQLVDEQVVEEDVEGGCYQENISTGAVDFWNGVPGKYLSGVFELLGKEGFRDG